MSDSISVSIALALIKSLVCIYDVITYPIYALLQKPNKSLNQTVRAQRIHQNDIYSPFVRVFDPQKSLIVEKHFIKDSKSVSDLFSRAVQQFGPNKCFGSRALLAVEDERQSDGKVFRKQILSDYLWFSYEDIDKRVDSLCSGLLWVGVKPYDNVLLLCETRLEWMVTCQAVFRLGATVVTLYATLGDDGLVHGINETKVRVIVTSHDLLDKLMRLEERIDDITAVVYMENQLKAESESSGQDKSERQFTRIKHLLKFSDLEKRGKQLFAENPDREVKQRCSVGGDDTAVLMYTSGSTGIPKGVMITHTNLLKATEAFFTIAHALSQEDVYIGYLPLAHVLELAAELFFFSLGMRIGYATPLTLTDKSTGIKRGVKGDATLLRPTVITAVPLVLDRIRKAIQEEVAAKGNLFKAFFEFCVEYKKFWTKKGFKTPLINRFICRKIKQMLGGNVRLMAVGSAPLAPETHDFIRTCLDLELLQGYGLTETSASATLMDVGDLSTGRVGPPLAGVQIKLVDWVEGNYRVSDKPNPRGEVVVGGDNITAGYYRNPELTKECYREEDGVKWFYTGDIGEMFGDGSLKIIDRKKDLVKLQFGEYVSLGKIEAELKSCAVVDNICVYGDSLHAFLIALVVPNHKQLSLLGQKLDKTGKSVKELCKDTDVVDAVVREIVSFGVKSHLHKMEIPLKVKLCSEEWIPDSGLVTAALKLRRKQIQDFYQMDINRMYGISDSKST